jgi:hypothetical protein
MFDRLETMGLATCAPHTITEHGRKVLAEAQSKRRI